MKICHSAQRKNGLTLVEVIVVICMIAMIAFIILPPSVQGNKARPGRIQCVNNLKQIGLAFRDWEGTQPALYPMAVSQTNHGTMEFTTGPNVWRHFQVLSNGLEAPKVLLCSAEAKRPRYAATNFATLSNSNISYFIGVDANDTNPQMILAGDRNITNGTLIENAILELTTNRPSGWTAEMHNGVGNLLLSDGSVQQVSMSGLRSAVENTGLLTNRLQMPVLSQ